MKYHLFLSSKRKRSDNCSPIYVKIFINNKVYERSIGVYIADKYWNRDFKRVVTTYNNAVEVNKILNDVEAKLNTPPILGDYTISYIDNLLKPQGNNSSEVACIDAINAYIKHKEKVIDTADGICNETYKSYFHKAKNINNFLLCELNKPHLLLTDFNYAIGEKLKAYLLAQHFGIPHINRHIKLMRSVIKYAQYQFNLLPSNFMLLKIKEPALKPIIYLTQQELTKLQTHVFLSGLMQKCADIFLLQCFTGMAYIDVMQLSQDNIVKNGEFEFIKYNRQKTNISGVIPLLPQVKAILNRYNGATPHLTNQVYNRILKEIATCVGINKPITSHVGRKTFGCMLLSKGASMETTTKMLAKTNVAETAKLYAEVSWERLLMEMPSFA
jgi:site-specific recombinase XerD